MVECRALSSILLILLVTYCSIETKEVIIPSIVHYGVHRVKACSDFEKAYLCIQKCLDLNFDLANADRKCKCTCFHNKELAQYTVKRSYNTTNWKLGVPATDLPPWQKHLVKPDEGTPLSDEETFSRPKPASKETNPFPEYE